MTASDLVADTSVEKPDEWPMRTAASFNPFITSGSRGWAKYYAGHGDLFMRITNLKRHRIKPDLSDRQHVALPASENEGLRTGLRHGDILISITADIGIIGYVDETVPTPAYINQHVACLRLPADQVSPKFVAYYLASSEPQRRFIEMTDVGAKTGINLTTVGKLTFPCPPLVEQEAIAEALSDADALIEGLERLIAKKRLIKQGAMQDLLTAKRRLPGFSGEWVARTLPELAEIRSGGTPSTSAPEMWDGDIAWCTPTDITSLKGARLLSKTSRYITDLGLRKSAAELLPEGTIVMTSRATIGECAIATVPISTNQGFKNFIARPDTDRDFLFYLLSLQKAGFIELCSGSTFLEIGMGQLRKYQVMTPEGPCEQKAIAQVLTDMDAELQALDTRLEKARQVKEGMMQNLLTGRIRLV